MGQNAIKKVTQVNEHFLKLHIGMFEKSQGKHINWIIIIFWKIFH
jgi:hypothetical protein